MDEKQKLIGLIKENGNFFSDGEKEKFLRELDAFSEEEQEELILLFQKHKRARQSVERLKEEWKITVAEFSNASLPAGKIIGKAFEHLPK